MNSRTIRPFIGQQVIEMVSVSRLFLATSILTTLFAVKIWADSLPAIEFSAMNDFGLISVLPPSALIAPVLVVVAFCMLLRDRSPNHLVLLFHLTVLIVMLYGTTSFVEEVARTQTAWRHVGIADVIRQTGEIDPWIDAYFNWPGFFVLSAFVTEIVGLQDVAGFLPWAPVALNLLYLAPLLVIFSTATSDHRLIWLAALIFVLANWVGQDYFSPQGFHFLLHLIILAILLKWFAVPTHRNRIVWFVEDRISHFAQRMNIFQRQPEPMYGVYPASQPFQRVSLLILVILLFANMTMSHQLTPFFTVTSVALLVVCDRCSARGLPILMAVMMGTWMSYMAHVYLSGHLEELTGHVGEVSSTVNASFGARLSGSEDHELVVRLRLLTAGSVWGLALLGGLQRLRMGYRDISLMLLAGAPFPFLILQPYGGEMLLRVYLFALPAMAFFVASLFFSTASISTTWRRMFLVVMICIGLTGGFLVSRYGNERMDYFTRDEITAVQYVYDIAEPNSLIMSATQNLPWKFQDYAAHRYSVLIYDDDWVAANSTEVDLELLQSMMNDPYYADAYLILTRSQYAHAELLGALPAGFLERLESALQESPDFRIVYAGRDANVYAPQNFDGDLYSEGAERGGREENVVSPPDRDVELHIPGPDTIYFPWVPNGAVSEEQRGTDLSYGTVTVQNLEEDDILVHYRTTHGGGLNDPETYQVTPLRAHESLTLTADELGVSEEGSKGSGVVLSGTFASSGDTAQIAAVQKQLAAYPSTTSGDRTAGRHQEVAGYTGLPANELGRELLLPIVQTNNGWNTLIRLTNFEDTAATVNLSLLEAGREDEEETIDLTIAAGETGTVDLLDEGFPAGWTGSAEISSDVKVAAVTERVKHDPNLKIMSASVLPSDMRVQYAPLVLHEWSGWSTGISIVNRADSPNQVTLSYYSLDGTQIEQISLTLPPKGMDFVYTPVTTAGDDTVPDDGFVGTAVIEGSAPFHGVVDTVKHADSAQGTNHAMSYMLDDQAIGIGESLALPLVKKGGEENVSSDISGIHLFNPSDETVVAAIWFLDQVGEQVLSTPHLTTIDAQQGHTVRTFDFDELPSGFRGSAVIQIVRGEGRVVALSSSVEDIVEVDGAISYTPVSTTAIDLLFENESEIAEMLLRDWEEE